MDRAVSIVCRPEVARGFALAGLAATAVTTPERGAAEVAGIIGNKDSNVGLVLVDEDVYAALSPELQAELRRRALPIVVPIPGPTWVPQVGAAEAYVAEVLGRAVGYRVRLR
ncbi:MAG: V-type ATP synthase subunit F [Deltaproteobacteria bacterium]|nr:V-type ATP synthase subunit F [Deltaproteobacteria bacterium]